MSSPLSFTDAQLASIAAAAQPLTPEQRNAFLLGVALKLKISRGPSAFPSDVLVAKAIAAVLREMEMATP